MEFAVPKAESVSQVCVCPTQLGQALWSPGGAGVGAERGKDGKITASPKNVGLGFGVSSLPLQCPDKGHLKEFLEELSQPWVNIPNSSTGLAGAGCSTLPGPREEPPNLPLLPCQAGCRAPQTSPIPPKSWGWAGRSVHAPAPAGAGTVSREEFHQSSCQERATPGKPWAGSG